jgi:hypothetical protein
MLCLLHKNQMGGSAGHNAFIYIIREKQVGRWRATREGILAATRIRAHCCSHAFLSRASSVVYENSQRKRRTTSTTDHRARHHLERTNHRSPDSTRSFHTALATRCNLCRPASVRIMRSTQQAESSAGLRDSRSRKSRPEKCRSPWTRRCAFQSWAGRESVREINNAEQLQLCSAWVNRAIASTDLP